MAQLYIGLALIITLLLSGLVGCSVERILNLPTWIAWIISVVFGFYFIYKMTMGPLKRKVKKELKALSTESLKKAVFRYEKDYFKEINENDPAVVRFREIIEKQDILALRKEWPKLSGRFGQLEREAGHQGRPLMLDYYCWYELDIDVLRKRMRKLRG